MTYLEKIIASAYTSTMFIEGSQLGDLYAYIESKVNTPVCDISFTNEFAQKVKVAAYQDFIDMINGKFADPNYPNKFNKYENTPPCIPPSIKNMH